MRWFPLCALAYFAEAPVDHRLGDGAAKAMPTARAVSRTADRVPGREKTSKPGAAEHLRESRGRRPIRADVPPDIPEAARQEGRTMPLEDALRYALQA
jgi:hypothetical protein